MNPGPWSNLSSRMQSLKMVGFPSSESPKFQGGPIFRWTTVSFREANLCFCLLWVCSFRYRETGIHPRFPKQTLARVAQWFQWCTSCDVVWTPWPVTNNSFTLCHSLLSKMARKKQKHIVVPGDLLYSHIQRWISIFPHLWRIISSKPLQRCGKLTHIHPFCSFLNLYQTSNETTSGYPTSFSSQDLSDGDLWPTPRENRSTPLMVQIPNLTFRCWGHFMENFLAISNGKIYSLKWEGLKKKGLEQARVLSKTNAFWKKKSSADAQILKNRILIEQH